MPCTGTLSMFDKDWTAYSYLTSSDDERPRMVLKVVCGLLWLLASYLRLGALYSVRLQRLVRHGSDLALALSWFWVSRQLRSPLSCLCNDDCIAFMIICSGGFHHPSMLSGLVSIDIPSNLCRFAVTDHILIQSLANCYGAFASSAVAGMSFLRILLGSSFAIFTENVSPIRSSDHCTKC